MNTLMVKDRIQFKTKLEHIVGLYEVIKNNHDTINTKKLEELYEKLDKKELMISFAGHFSAGKSSMINAILGEDILPKSPIPTSANVVKINSGKGVARVYFHDSDPVEYKEPYDIDMIKEYSKDKDAIKKLEISTAKRIVPEGVALMDTPGIDAADDADRLMTEGSLHLVDMLFYVMDYNHVQSEVNLQFLHTLHEKQIPFYVIINQIDKHDETEIAFEAFDRSVKQTFEQWRIIPKDIFYASLIDDHAKHNQFKKIKNILFQMMDDREKYFNIDHAVDQVVSAHKHFLKTKYEDKLANYTTDHKETDRSSIAQEMSELETKLQHIEYESLSFKKDFQDNLNNTLKNAYLMPADLRDKAEAFLTSQQRDFKIGIFSSKKKTAQEQDLRIDAFLTSLQKNIEASIQWKLRDKLLHLLKQYNITDPALQNEIQQEIVVIYTNKNLVETIKPGAKINGDYVLNYTSDVVSDIKSRFRKKALNLSGKLELALDNKNINKKNLYITKLKELKQAQSVENERNKIQSYWDEKLKLLSNQLYSPVPDAVTWNNLKNRIIEREKTIIQVDTQEQFNKLKNKVVDPIEVPEIEQRNDTHAVTQILESMEETIDLINGLPGFQAIINDLNEKRTSLEKRSYTIALFGAFSAGKSSFANALLGESVLPVSPNPTTATVNRIRPVTQTHQHGTVVVTMKDHDTLKNDLMLITRKFSPDDGTFYDLLQWIQKNDLQHNQQLNNMFQAYLKAMIAGFQENKNNIGKTVTISLDDFAAYVSDETKACFVESIDLYYDCSITKQGITLVDTPGADSVNARHTNVAFEYIKHADAILYVTYYNHALSRADKDFLMQLGRVKEAFELDKMFFVINAADLAVDDDELQLVINYVQEQLVQLGIRFPRLYPVSSKNSLYDKRNNQVLNEQMQYFESDFYQFIHHDLSMLTVQSALWDMRRAHDTMRHYMESLQLDEQQKTAQKNKLITQKTTLKQEIMGVKSNVYEDQLRQKIEKQLFYVLERFSIRFHEIFKEFFNPTTITESGRKVQLQLRNNLQDLLDYTGSELHQELQAVSLRIEAFMQSQASAFYTLLIENSKQIDDTFELPNLDMIQMETPEYEKAFQKVDTIEFDKVLAMFKGTKSFFEKNEKEFMKEALYERLYPFAKEYLDVHHDIMVAAYCAQWQDVADMMKDKIMQYAEKHLDDYLNLLQSPVDMTLLSNKQGELTEVLKKYTEEEKLGE